MEQDQIISSLFNMLQKSNNEKINMQLTIDKLTMEIDALKKETKKDPYTGKSEVTSESAADKAAKTKLNIGSPTQKKEEPNKTTTRKAKRDKKNFPGGKEGYTRQEKSGARQSSARNSVARQAYLRKKAKLKIKKDGN